MGKSPSRGKLRVAPKRADAKDSVEVILDATERVARKIGFEAATTTMIAKVAGVSVGTLYRYFPSKDALLTALVRRQWEAGARAFVERLQEEIAARRIHEQPQRYEPGRQQQQACDRGELHAETIDGPPNHWIGHGEGQSDEQHAQPELRARETEIFR